MFTKTEDFNVFDDDKLIVPFVENRIVHNVPHVLLVAFCKEEHGLCVPIWSTEQAFAIRVFSQAFKDGSDSTSELLLSSESLLGTFFETFTGSSACVVLVPA